MEIYIELIVLSDNSGVFMQTESGLKKLEGFSEFNFNAGAECYVRKYFSSEEKTVDITGTRPVISYKFDRMKNNIVHDFFALVSDLGLKVEDARKKFVFVDLSEEFRGRYKAFMQEFDVISYDRRPENGFLDYSGKLVARDEAKKGYVILNEDLISGEFIPERSGILCD